MAASCVAEIMVVGLSWAAVMQSSMQKTAGKIEPLNFEK
jgi:hypothetical protein